MNLRKALEDYVDTVTLGASNKKIQLREALERVRARNERYFVASAAFLVVMFVAAIAIIVSHATDTKTWTLTSAVFGMSLAGMARMMLGLWREKVTIDLLIELAGHDDAVLRDVSRALLRTLPRGRTETRSLPGP